MLHTTNVKVLRNVWIQGELGGKWKILCY